MLFDAESKPHLRAWLVRTLEPICDADPGALADYVAAILDRDSPESELRVELVTDMEDFLQKDGPKFIDQLFNVLRTKSYLPYNAASSSGTGGPTADMDTAMGPPPNAPTSPRAARKRPLEDDGSERPPPKGPRIGGFNNGRHPPMGPAAGMNGMSGHVNPHRQPGEKVFIPPEQMNGICRDYHVKGFCSRGSMCKYSHSDDAILPPGPMPFMAPPFAGGPPQFGGPGPDGYNPHNPQMNMNMPQPGPRQFVPGLGRYHYTPRPAIAARGADPGGQGELPVIQDLTPKDPDADASEGEGKIDDTSNGDRRDGPSQQDRSRPNQEYAPRRFNGPPMNGGNMMRPPSHMGMPHMQGMGMGMMGMRMGMNPMGPMGQMNSMNPMGQMGSTGSMPMDVDGGGMMPGPRNMMQGGFRGPPQDMRGMHSGGPPGTFAAPAPGFNTERPAPPAPSGVGRPAVAHRDSKTLVVEKIPGDKLSIESVTGWFRRFGSVTNVAVDHKGSKALVSFDSHPEAAKAHKAEDAVFGNRFVKVFWHRPMEGQGGKGHQALARSADTVSKIAATPVNTELAERQQQLEASITRQKELMAKLATTAGEEKKAVFAELRELGAQIKAATGGSAFPTAAKKLPLAAPPAEGDEEQKKREQLDRDLDAHADKPEMKADGEAASETDVLKAQLAKLQEEAASLGLDPATAAAIPGAFRGRGRGRGRGAPRGSFYARGGAGGRATSRPSMRLDNRPRVLRVSGMPQDRLQGVKDWYEAAGGVDKVDTLDDGNVLVHFKSRAAAEVGFAKGINIPTVGNVSISWHASAAPKTTAATTASAGAAGPEATEEYDEIMPETIREDGDELTADWGAGGDSEDMI